MDGGKAIGIPMTIDTEGDLSLPAIPDLLPSDNPATVALVALAQEVYATCQKINSILAKLRKAGYLTII